jgi:hypothetical protein
LITTIDDESTDVDALNEIFSRMIWDLTKRRFDDDRREDWEKMTTQDLCHWSVIYVRFISKLQSIAFLMMSRVKHQAHEYWLISRSRAKWLKIWSSQHHI